MSSINFDNVWLLFIAVPLVALFAVPFAIAIRKENANKHNIASMALHVLMALLIAFAAAGTYIVTIITETQVYVVADVSYSAHRNLDTVDGYIRNLSLPKYSKLGVVCFGKDYELLTGLGESFTTVRDADVDDTETDVKSALEYTATLFDDDVIKRIVLITDGKETYAGEGNRLKSTVDGLSARGIYVDAIYLDNNIPANAREVQISSADYTKSAYINKEERVNVFVQSSVNTRADITLYRNGELFDRMENTSISLGTNNKTFNLYTEEVGTSEYRVEIRANDDEVSYNNTYSFTQTVTGAVNVLFITSKNSDLRYAEELYGEDAVIDGYVNNPAVPSSVEALCKYDEIIISDIDVATLNDYELFLENVDKVVSLFGKSLVTFGNLGIQAAKEGQLSKLDNMLPIRYGETGVKKLYTIVLDVSHSLIQAGWGRFDNAKLAATSLVNSLNEGDYVSLITFSGNFRPLYSAVPVTEASREEITNTIKGLQTEQGTLIGVGLEEACDQIVELQKTGEFSEMQVMLITDGIDFEGHISYGGAADLGLTDKQYAELKVEEMSGYGVITSVAQIGTYSNIDGVDTAWLTNLARLGGGKFTTVENTTQAAIRFNENAGKQDADIVITNQPSRVTWSRDEVVSNVNFYLPSVKDFILGTSKTAATEALHINYIKGKVTLKMPLYSYWNYGNGKIASYSGEIAGITNYYTENTGEVNRKFFGNVINAVTPSEKTDYPYSVDTVISGKAVRINLTPVELQPNARATLTMTAPDGQTTVETLVFDSSKYFYQFNAREVGKYTIGLVYSYNGNDYAADASFNVSYEPEYDSFDLYEASVLYRMLSAGGTVSEDGNLSIVNDENEISTYTLELTIPFLIAAVALFVIDIVIRKLKWKDIVSLFVGIGGKKSKKQDKGGKQ